MTEKKEPLRLPDWASEYRRAPLVQRCDVVIEELEDRIVEMTENPPPGMPGMDDEAMRSFHEKRAAHTRQLAELCTALAAMHTLAAWGKP
jgi:hypothetical protein